MSDAHEHAAAEPAAHTVEAAELPTVSPGEVLLEVEDLHTTFSSPRGPVHAVRGISLELRRGRTLGVVGESGSGKSVLSRSIMGLMPSNASRTGSVRFAGSEILNADAKVMRTYWGDQMSMVFQDPMTALNPVLRIEQQITESLHEHTEGLRAEPTRPQALCELARGRGVAVREPLRGRRSARPAGPRA